MNDKTLIHSYLDESNILLNDLLGMDVKINEEQTTLLLCLMSNTQNNLIKSLRHAIKLDMDFVVASLLSEELRIKFLETNTSYPGLQASVSEESNVKARDTNNNRKGKEKFKLKGDIKYYCCDKVNHIMKHWGKLTKNKHNAKDKEQGMPLQ